mmetsp:Transcript_12074/g.24283  ORF Transcript_12074/g.24283 Transcript_12074/m.24283 type:complete len:206 (+) Transcript_12074:275-892(+)
MLIPDNAHRRPLAKRLCAHAPASHARTARARMARARVRGLHAGCHVFEAIKRDPSPPDGVVHLLEVPVGHVFLEGLYLLLDVLEDRHHRLVLRRVSVLGALELLVERSDLLLELLQLVLHLLEHLLVAVAGPAPGRRERVAMRRHDRVLVPLPLVLRELGGGLDGHVQVVHAGHGLGPHAAGELQELLEASDPDLEFPRLDRDEV